MVGDFPWLGSGFGTFINVYPSCKTVLSNLVFDYAHNDYLEVMVGGGLVGFGLAAWFCVQVMLNGWRMVLVRRDRLAVLVGIGAIVSVCALLGGWVEWLLITGKRDQAIEVLQGRFAQAPSQLVQMIPIMVP